MSVDYSAGYTEAQKLDNAGLRRRTAKWRAVMGNLFTFTTSMIESEPSLPPPKALLSYDTTQSSHSSSSTGLSSLPAELLIKVFTQLPTFTDGTRLSSTARLFYSIWQEHFSTIYLEIAPSDLTCFSEAQDLLATQLRHSTLSIAEQVQMLLTNARTVHRLSRMFEYESRSHFWDIAIVCRWENLDEVVAKAGVLSASERLRLTSFLYQLLTLNTLQYESLDDELAGYTCRRLYCLKDVVTWVCDNVGEEERALLRLPEWTYLLVKVATVYGDKELALYPGHQCLAVAYGLGVMDHSTAVMDRFQEDYVEQVPDVIL